MRRGHRGWPHGHGRPVSFHTDALRFAERPREGQDCHDGGEEDHGHGETEELPQGIVALGIPAAKPPAR